MMTEATASAQLRLRAPAKINLGLSVLGRRSDGFHQIDTLFARLELHDRITLQAAASTGGEVTGVGEGLSLHGLAMDRANLAWRAAEAYLAEAGIPAGVHIALSKRIPVAAGLGGGSSDAAAVLLGLSRLFPAGVDLIALASQLGSDVAFFLSQQPAAWAGGRGEILEPARSKELPLVLLNPGVAVSAAEAYRLVRSYGGPLERDQLLAQLGSEEEPSYFNSLQEGVVAAYPEVGRALRALAEAGLRGVLMSGSGPTCFGIARSEERARTAEAQLKATHPDWWCWSGLAGV